MSESNVRLSKGPPKRPFLSLPGVLKDGLERKIERRRRELADALAALRAEMKVRAAEEDHLRELSGEVLRVQDEERRRIARELHDGTGQTLSALKMALGILEESFPLISKSAALKDVRQFSDDALREIRTTSYLLHPPLLDETGLESSLRWFTSGYSERSRVATSLILDGEHRRLPADHELCLFRVAQECLTNIHRHSGSKTAIVRLKRKPETVMLEVIDQGKGFPEDLHRKFISGETAGVGLRSMRERVRKLDGRMEIQSDRRGTAVTVMLPLGRGWKHRRSADPVNA